MWVSIKKRAKKSFDKFKKQFAIGVLHVKLIAKRKLPNISPCLQVLPHASRLLPYTFNE
jgi:hypothetical protein